MPEKILLIDGNSIMNRAFYALPDMTDASGRHTNAIYGFLNMMFHFIDEEKPEYLAVAFDVHAPTFRHEMYAAYKGTRKPAPAELHEQLALIRDVLDSMGVGACRKSRTGS
jgi:DNA polymerase-1